MDTQVEEQAESVKDTIMAAFDSQKIIVFGSTEARERNARVAIALRLPIQG